MGDWKKTIVLQILLCATCSALIAFLVSGLYSIRNDGEKQISTQIVTINERPVTDKIDINTATQSELETIPGIGEKRAQAIIKNRPYNDIWEIADIKGFGNVLMAEIAQRAEVKK